MFPIQFRKVYFLFQDQNKYTASCQWQSSVKTDIALVSIYSFRHIRNVRNYPQLSVLLFSLLLKLPSFKLPNNKDEGKHSPYIPSLNDHPLTYNSTKKKTIIGTAISRVQTNGMNKPIQIKQNLEMEIEYTVLRMKNRCVSYVIDWYKYSRDAWNYLGISCSHTLLFPISSIYQCLNIESVITHITYFCFCRSVSKHQRPCLSNLKSKVNIFLFNE